jgi:hypothetical protein
MSGDSAAVPSATWVLLPPLRMFAPGSSLRVGGPADGLAPGFLVEGGAWRTSLCRFLSRRIGEGRADGERGCFKEHRRAHFIADESPKTSARKYVKC